MLGGLPAINVKAIGTNRINLALARTLMKHGQQRNSFQLGFTVLSFWILGYAGELEGGTALEGGEADFLHGSNVVRIYSPMGAGARWYSLSHALCSTLIC